MTDTSTGIAAVPGIPEGIAESDTDYWFGLITEQEAGEFMTMTPRWLQAKRQLGGGPKFVRISMRCVRYRRFDLKEYSDRQLRSSTSDDGPLIAA